MFKPTLFSVMLVSLFQLFSRHAHAQSESAAEFLVFFPPGSRANAMGSANTAVADDIYALHFNPAGIARLQKGGAAFFHHSLGGRFGLPMTFVGAAYRTQYGTFGTAVNNLNLDDSFLGEELNSYERSMQITYANQLGEKVAVGASLKWIRQRFDNPGSNFDVTANGVGLDVGILVQNIFPHWTISRRSESFPQRFRKFDRSSFQGLSLGLALLNTGPDRLEFIENQRDPLPQTLRIGVAYNAVDTDEIGILVAADLDKELVERDESGVPDGFVESWITSWDNGFDHFQFGAEINLYHILAFRFGRDEFLNFSEDSSVDWTFGFGLGPEWARVNLVHRRFPAIFSEEKWVVDLVVNY
jgi:hypothetical protein